MAPRRRPWDDLPQLVTDLSDRLEGSDMRFLLGITGPPAAGKSSVAERIVAVASKRVASCVAPMDGFHRANADLEANGLLPLKGVPATFDGAGFVTMLRALRAGDTDVAWPTYDRTVEEVVPGAQPIITAVRLVVVEGNYLLLDSPPWNEVQQLLDEVWFLDVPVPVIVTRLLERHGRDRSAEEAAAKVASTDLPNAELVERSRNRADVILTARPPYSD